MNRRPILAALFTLLTASTVAYGPFDAFAHEGLSKDYNSFITDITSAGGIVETNGEISQPFFAVKGHRITVNGSEVQVFEFSSHIKASAEAALVSPDGSSVGATPVNWTAKPHFYNSGKLIVLYLGESMEIQNLIESVIGSQFAGR